MALLSLTDSRASSSFTVLGLAFILRKIILRRLARVLSCSQNSMSSQCWPTCCLPVLGNLTTTDSCLPLAALCRDSRVRSSSKSPSHSDTYSCSRCSAVWILPWH